MAARSTGKFISLYDTRHDAFMEGLGLLNTFFIVWKVIEGHLSNMAFVFKSGGGGVILKKNQSKFIFSPLELFGGEAWVGILALK